MFTYSLIYFIGILIQEECEAFKITLAFVAIHFLSVLDKSAPVVGSSSIPNGVIFLGKGVNVESVYRYLGLFFKCSMYSITSCSFSFSISL